MVVDQQVFHLGDDGKFPVVQHLGQIGAGLPVGKIRWRQRSVGDIRPGFDFIDMNKTRVVADLWRPSGTLSELHMLGRDTAGAEHPSSSLESPSRWRGGGVGKREIHPRDSHSHRSDSTFPSCRVLPGCASGAVGSVSSGNTSSVLLYPPPAPAPAPPTQVQIF